MSTLSNVISTLDNILWGWPLIVLLFGTHIFMTFRTGFIQKDIFKAIRLSVQKDQDAQGDVSQFGALTTALSSTIGTGNIIGVGTAIACGGPGAVLWMWLTGIFGIATKYAETIISVKYRVKSEDGTMIGGAMYALDRVCGSCTIIRYDPQELPAALPDGPRDDRREERRRGRPERGRHL